MDARRLNNRSAAYVKYVSSGSIYRTPQTRRNLKITARKIKQRAIKKATISSSLSNLKTTGGLGILKLVPQ